MAAAELTRDLLSRALIERVQPFVSAGERRLPVAEPLGALVPGGGLQRGATVTVAGAPGAGSTTVALTLAAAATSAGDWAAVVDPHGTLGARAAVAAGVELERCAVVRPVPADRWATVVAALLDGVALVVASVPMRLRAGDARRLVAKARERAAVLVAVGQWPVEAALRLEARASAWEVAPSGLLTCVRDIDVHVQHRGMPARGQLRAVG